MRHWVVILGACVLCAAALTAQVVTAEQAAVRLAVAEAMYSEHHVVGQIIAAEKMYSPKAGTWWDLSLEVESMDPGDAGSSSGEAILVSYDPEALDTRARPGLGDDVELDLVRKELAGEVTWSAASILKVLGRGELLNPGEGAVTDLGSADAKLLIKMFAPMRPDCHRKTATLLAELAEREPARVRVQVFDMMTPEGRAETNRERLRCATVLVNNRYQFTLSGGDAERNVQFHRRPNSPNAMYNSEDVVAVAEQELKRLYADETDPEQE